MSQLAFLQCKFRKKIWPGLGIWHARIVPVFAILLPIQISSCLVLAWYFKFGHKTNVYMLYHASQQVLMEEPESIAWFIEDKAFLRSYNSAPRPPFPPLQQANCLSFAVFLCVDGQAYWRESGGGGGRGAKIQPRKTPDLYKSVNTLWEKGRTLLYITGGSEYLVQKIKIK